MLVRLPNKLIPEYWSFFKDALRECVPAEDCMATDRMSKFLDWALLGFAHAWLIYFDDSDDLAGVGLSTVGEDPISGQKTLIIQAYKLYRVVPFAKQAENFATFKQFAKDNNIPTISAYSGNKGQTLEFARLTSGKISYLTVVEV